MPVAINMEFVEVSEFVLGVVLEVMCLDLVVLGWLGFVLPSPTIASSG